MTMKHVWFLRGYKDAITRQVYAHAPTPGEEPPCVPDEDLSEDWQEYLRGVLDGGEDRARSIMREANKKPRKVYPPKSA